MFNLKKIMSTIYLAAILPVASHAEDPALARMEINPSAATLAQTEIFIDASPSAVWSTITEVNNWTKWLPEIVSARIDGPLAPGSTIYWQPQGQVVESRIVFVQSERKLVWNGTDGAVHVWELIPQGKGTLLKNNESIENWRLADGAVNGSIFLTETLKAWNQRIADHVVD